LENTLYCGNNVDIIKKEIPTNSVDLIVTSPPYDEIRDYNNFAVDLHGLGIESFRVLKDGGILAMVINDGTKDFGKSLTTYRTIIDYCDNCGFKLFENIIYSRFGRPGAWWNKRFRVDHEYILLFLKGYRPKYFNKELLKIDAIHSGEIWQGTQRLTNGSLIPIEKTLQKDKKCRGTIWKYNTSNTEKDKMKLLHPATFPDKLAEDLILCFSEEGDIVLDPFVGSGTTCIMAKKNNRKWIGIDISDKYISLSNKRMNNNKQCHT
jgi:site-specific DNA-methyltransferase (adenine-specific)